MLDEQNIHLIYEIIQQYCLTCSFHLNSTLLQVESFILDFMKMHRTRLSLKYKNKLPTVSLFDIVIDNELDLSDIVEIM